MTPTGLCYASYRELWLWWLTDAADNVAGMRAAAPCLMMAQKNKEAADLLSRASRLESEGIDAVPDGSTHSQADLKRTYLDVTGLDVDDPAVKAKIAAAEAAMKRAERERADAAALKEQERQTKLNENRERRRRRGRR